MYKIVLKKKAKKFIDKLPLNEKKRIVAAIEKLPEGEDIKKLQGYDNVLRLRVGTYRIIYTVDNGKLIIKPYMLCSFRYKLVTFFIALIPVILWPVFLILSLCFLWLLWFVVSFANFVIFLTVYRNILQALCFSQSGSVTCCRSKTKPEHKPHQRSGTQPDTAKRNTTN